MKYDFLKEVLSQTSNLHCSTERCLDLVNCIAIKFINFKKELEPPSSAVVALSANAGSSLTQSLSCGFNCITDKHLLLEKICDFLDSEPLNNLQQYTNGTIIPGMGHPSIKGRDPRVQYLLKEFSDIAGDRVAFYTTMENILPVYINIGGAMCSLMLDAGINKNYVSYFPLIGRMFGWNKTHTYIASNHPKVKPSGQIIHEP